MPIPTLPQNDPVPGPRAALLDAARQVYRYSYDLLPPLALAAEVPPPDQAGLEWYAGVADAYLDILVNTGKVDQDEGRSKRDHAPFTAMHALIGAGENGGMKGVFRELNSLIMNGLTQGRPASIGSYAELFQEWERPAIVETYAADLSFARMRLAGPNPVWIERVAAPPGRFPVSEAHYQRAMGEGDSLEAAGKEGRLFLADYGVLAGVTGGTYPHGVQKCVAAPMALFAVPPDGAADRSLRPVAIQCGQTPGAGTPIFTPGDGHAWMMAKTAVQTADGNCHQAVSHLARTHLVVEPFVVATRRQLSLAHPLSVLLLPHFEGTLNINESAATNLIAPGGGVDIVMAPTIEESRGLAAKGVETWDFTASMLPADLARRGVEDTGALPEYPYRDDALLVWRAIHDWVEAYLKLYYPGGDGDVVADAELRAWAAEVASPTGGRLKGVGPITTVAGLVDAVAHIVFTASAQHAAVNFPQWQLMSFVPNLPLANFRGPPTSAQATEQDYLDMLPPLDAAQMQASLGYLLGTFHHTTLGDYQHRLFGTHFVDPRVEAPLRAFDAAIQEIESTVIGRNEARSPYIFLQPSLIPQSINI